MRIYREDHSVIRRLLNDQREVMLQPRGFGFWLWKPHIIADAIDSVPPGSTVLYSDAAVIYAAHPLPLLEAAAKHDIVTFLNKPSNTQSRYTKRDCFVLLGADNPIEWKRRQLDAAFLILRATDTARAFLREWAATMTDARVLTDIPNTCGLPNLDDFVDHRHDQSILTILAARAGLPSLESPASQTAPYGRIFYHHTFDVFVDPLRFGARLIALRLGLWPNRLTRKTRRRKRSKFGASKPD